MVNHGTLLSHRLRRRLRMCSATAIASGISRGVRYNHVCTSQKAVTLMLPTGHDADIVVWDSHPLALGATPKMVFIDGISQLENAHVLNKPESFQKLPEVPNFDREAELAVEYEGLPPLAPKKKVASSVLFTNVAEVVFSSKDALSASVGQPASVLVQGGRILCAGADGACATTAAKVDAEVIDLEGGSIQPGLATFGAPHGVVEIDQEDTTNDGVSLASVYRTNQHTLILYQTVCA
jgi:hypothetical protein